MKIHRLGNFSAYTSMGIQAFIVLGDKLYITVKCIYCQFIRSWKYKHEKKQHPTSLRMSMYELRVNYIVVVVLHLFFRQSKPTIKSRMSLNMKEEMPLRILMVEKLDNIKFDVISLIKILWS